MLLSSSSSSSWADPQSSSTRITESLPAIIFLKTSLFLSFISSRVVFNRLFLVFTSRETFAWICSSRVKLFFSSVILLSSSFFSSPRVFPKFLYTNAFPLTLHRSPVSWMMAWRLTKDVRSPPGKTKRRWRRLRRSRDGWTHSSCVFFSARITRIRSCLVGEVVSLKLKRNDRHYAMMIFLEKLVCLTTRNLKGIRGIK